ncbi:MAG: hypothetical protein F4X97_06280 [Boseongicola sp. SB0662_bin_57]|nr:hypothetical protein [Boseongicola sp. SB0662_bin_57]
MRTIKQHTHRLPIVSEWQEVAKMKELKETISRNAATLPGDFAGGAALVLLTFIGVSLSGFF